MEKKSFIKLIENSAKHIMSKYNILASLTIAQAILESGWGESECYKLANNVYGIKGEYEGEFIEIESPEVVNKTEEMKLSKFKKYPSIKECFEDRINMILNNKLNKKEYRYRNLINVKDYKEACILIQKDGYSNSQDYADTLIKIIEDNNLYEIDKSVLETPNIDVSNVKPGDNPTHNIIEVIPDKLVKEDLYRVRLTAISSGKQKGTFSILEDAIKECDKHIGYNVYNTSGLLLHESIAKDPSVKPKPSINSYLFMKGMMIDIINSPIYDSSTTDIESRNINGKYYIYDGIKFGSRYRITKELKHVEKGSQYVIGYIDKKKTVIK